MKNNESEELKLLPENSWLTPNIRRVGAGLLVSAAVHLIGYAVLTVVPIARLALGFQDIKFTDTEYNRAILIDFSKPLKYPGNYSGFAVPAKTVDLEKVKKTELQRQKTLKKVKEKEAERIEKEAQLEAQRRVKAEVIAKSNPPKTEEPKKEESNIPPKASATTFKPINTRPIRDQIQRLYELQQEGNLVFDETRLRVGVSGDVQADGSIKNERVAIKSGNPQIDRAALAIIKALSESNALGPLARLTSLTIILDVNEQRAQLTATGFAKSSEEVSQLQFLAWSGLKLARNKKDRDSASMLLLNNIQVSQTGNRLQATITVPRQVAVETVAKTLSKN